MKKHRIFPAVSVLLSVLMLSVLLTACVHRYTLEMENPDGTVTVIRCESSGGFMRSPVFTVTSGRSLVMSFNGIDWYCASIITAEEYAPVAAGKVLSESTNMKVYRAEDGCGFAYTYILDPEGTDEAFIRFDTDAEPGQDSIGNDFDMCITYEVSGTATVPDISGLPPYEYPDESAEPEFSL